MSNSGKQKKTVSVILIIKGSLVVYYLLLVIN